MKANKRHLEIRTKDGRWRSWCGYGRWKKDCTTNTLLVTCKVCRKHIWRRK